MSTIIKFNPVRAVDGNGEPVPGAQARFFVSGTTTPITVFQDAAQTTPHPSPLVADAAGVFPLVYRAGTALKVEVRTPAGVILPGFPIDPAFAVDTAGVGAIGVGFNPTAEIPVTNTQAAIERVQLNITAPVAAVGIGVTGNAPTLPNVNATNTASGFYRFTGTATGDLPLGFSSETGIVYFLRETSDTGWQFAARKDVDGLWFRRLLAGTWQTWRRVIDGSMAADQATWNAGTDTVERPVSPAKVKAAVEAQVPALVTSTAASATVGAVGTYALLSNTDTATEALPGDTRPGSALRYAPTDGNRLSSPIPGGTWRCMGWSFGSGRTDTTLWLRIS
jgi:hypothetical protein